MAEKSPHIIDVTVETFERDVVERSRSVPVIVDFWATWCQPCLQLAPLLEKLANEYAGKFVLAKINVDASPDLAGAFGVQSIPHVFAVRDGQAVNHFMGLLPEDQLREWLSSLLPTPAEQALNEGQTLAAANPAAAEARLRDALHLDPKLDKAKIALAGLLLQQGREQECATVMAELTERGFLEPEAEKIKSELDLRLAAEEAGGLVEARRASQAAPDDLSLKLKLADALAASRKYEEALEICLALVQQDKLGIGVEAKETMLKIFDVLGPGSELVGRYRRKLATALY